MAYQTDFRTSINIKYDIGKDSFLNNYLPTPSHAESIIGISQGFTDDSSNSAHILVGPYGSGKSLLATILASIVSKTVAKKTIDNLIEGFNKVHQGVYGSLVHLNTIKKAYIPVTLNGSYDDFADTLLTNIQKELEIRNIVVNLPTERNNVLKTIDLWKQNFPSTYTQFFEEVTIHAKRAKSFERWTSLVEEGSQEEIDWFKSIYSRLTSGAVFDSYSNGDINNSLEIILKTLKNNNLGLFIVHDEFGRFLQGLEQSKINKTMQDLQDIAEFVNRTDGYIHLLLISHRSMSRYMVGFYEGYQSEFERIEKRYSSYYVESDSATYYRIVQRYLTSEELNDTHHILEKEKQRTAIEIKSFNLFEELNQHEIDNLVVKGCYPVHPVTLFILPRISRVFGQNERTLFTYLTSTESHSFNSQLEKGTKYVYADSLFQYFFSDEGVEDSYDENTKQIIRLYLSIRSNLDARKTNAYRVIRFITLWELTNSNNVFRINKELISFATGIDSNTLTDVLDELIELKFVRFNMVQNKLELSEGSSVIIDELIESEKIDLNITDEARLNLLYKSLNKKYYLATDYNDKKNITRFMRTNLIKSSYLLNSDFDHKELMTSQSDGSINVIILSEKSDYWEVEEFVKQIKHPNIIFAVIKNDLQNIEDSIDNLIAIEALQGNEKLIHEYKNLKSDLEIYYENYHYEIKNYLNAFLKFKDTVDWFYKGKPIFLRSDLELEDTISNIMSELYAETPIIMNDAINRFNIFGIQKRSLLSFMDKVLERYDEENIGIEGQGPEYLIYATLIKNAEIDLMNLNNIGDVHVNAMRNTILEYIQENETGHLDELFNLLNKSPFGIRPPLVPVYMVILMRDRWNQFIFYRNEMFVPANDGEKIYEMFKNPESYDYVFQNFSSEKTTFLNNLEQKFSTYISENVADESQIIKVSSGLLNWLRSLPKQTQITNKFVEERLIKLKAIIRKSEVNPLASFEELTDLYRGNLTIFENDINTLSNSFTKFETYVETKLCDILGMKSFNQKDEFFNKWNKDNQLKNNLLTALNNSESIEEFSFNYIGTAIQDWSDINYELFINQLNSDYSKLFSRDEVDANIYELQVNDTYKQVKKVDLSRKSEVIYNNMERMIKNAGRTVSRDEINYMLLKLINDHID